MDEMVVEAGEGERSDKSLPWRRGTMLDHLWG